MISNLPLCTGDDVNLHEFFKREYRLQDFFVQDVNKLSADQAVDMINSKLNLTKIVEDTDLSFLQTMACNVDLFAFFIDTDDFYALQRLSDAVCGLAEQDFIDFVNLIQRNFDSKFLGEQIETLFLEASSWSFFDLIGDVGDLVGVALGVPSLEQKQDEIPPIAHLELWFHDLEDTVESIWRNWPHYDWTILDSVADLTLGVYIDGDTYDAIKFSFTEAANLLQSLVRELDGNVFVSGF